MTETTRTFTRAPITVAVGDRTVEAHRITFRHAQAWVDAWAEFALIERTDPDNRKRIVELSAKIVRAGFPEPDPELGCTATCPCAANVGLHALIETLPPDEFDALFEAVLEVNRPKDAPPTSAAGVGLTPRKRWPVWSLRAFLSRAPSTSP